MAYLKTFIVTLGLSVAPLSAFAADQPNILLIIADDMGLDASRCYALGDQQAPMPNVEALCASGMVFENAYSAPVCSPTRATIMTGQYGFRTGVGAAIPPNGGTGLSADVTSLFDVLATTDYSANLIGKWHLAGMDAGLDHPAQLGVPDYFGLFKGGTPSYFQWTAVTDGAEVSIDEYSTTVFTDHAIDWIAAQDAPWFLWLAYNAPHAPFHLPPADLHSFDDLPDDKAAIANNPLPYYNAMLEALDTEIGRLLASLTPEVRDNTIIVFIGDNGSPNQVTRGFYGDHAAKGTIYEGGTHVPLVVAGSGVDTGRTDGFVTTSDLFATIAGLAGAAAQSADTHDFRPLLSGGAGSRDAIYVEHFSDTPPNAVDVYGWAMRVGDFKLVHAEDKNLALYNLSDDPLEAVNLLTDGISDDEAVMVAEIEARIAALHEN